MCGDYYIMKVINLITFNPKYEYTIEYNRITCAEGYEWIIRPQQTDIDWVNRSWPKK
jgi:hypothetical protein